MKMINKIAVALDGSNSAINATNYAIELAKKVSAKIEIISIIKYSLGNIEAGILPQVIEKENEKQAMKSINKIKNEHKDVLISNFETVGIPEKEIIKQIKIWNADLLILGHHTHSIIENLFIKSVEKKLINHIECPILIIPKKFKTYK